MLHGYVHRDFKKWVSCSSCINRYIHHGKDSSEIWLQWIANSLNENSRNCMHGCETSSTISINTITANTKHAQTAHVCKITNYIPDSMVGWTYFRKLESSSMFITGVVWLRKQTDFLHASNNQQHCHPAVNYMISSRPVWSIEQVLDWCETWGIWLCSEAILLKVEPKSFSSQDQKKSLQQRSLTEFLKFWQPQSHMGFWQNNMMDYVPCPSSYFP